MYMEKVNEIKRDMGKRFNKKIIGDLLYGFTWEDKVLRTLHKTVNPNIKKYKDNFSNFDFYLKNDENETVCELELKTRRTYRNQYRTVPASIDKLKKAKLNSLNGVNSYFIYNFDNQNDRTKKTLYYYKFNPNQEGVEWFIGKIINKKTNGKKKECIHIKTKYLKSLMKHLKDDLP